MKTPVLTMNQLIKIGPNLYKEKEDSRSQWTLRTYENPNIHSRQEEIYTGLINILAPNTLVERRLAQHAPTLDGTTSTFIGSLWQQLPTGNQSLVDIEDNQYERLGEYFIPQALAVLLFLNQSITTIMSVNQHCINRHCIIKLALTELDPNLTELQWATGITHHDTSNVAATRFMANLKKNQHAHQHYVRTLFTIACLPPLETVFDFDGLSPLLTALQSRQKKIRQLLMSTGALLTLPMAQGYASLKSSLNLSIAFLRRHQPKRNQENIHAIAQSIQLFLHEQLHIRLRCYVDNFYESNTFPHVNHNDFSAPSLATLTIQAAIAHTYSSMLREYSRTCTSQQFSIALHKFNLVKVGLLAQLKNGDPHVTEAALISSLANTLFAFTHDHQFVLFETPYPSMHDLNLDQPKADQVTTSKLVIYFMGSIIKQQQIDGDDVLCSKKILSVFLKAAITDFFQAHNEYSHTYFDKYVELLDNANTPEQISLFILKVLNRLPKDFCSRFFRYLIKYFLFEMLTPQILENFATTNATCPSQEPIISRYLQQYLKVSIRDEEADKFIQHLMQIAMRINAKGDGWSEFSLTDPSLRVLESSPDLFFLPKQIVQPAPKPETSSSSASSFFSQIADSASHAAATISDPKIWSEGTQTISGAFSKFF